MTDLEQVGRGRLDIKEVKPQKMEGQTFEARDKEVRAQNEGLKCDFGHPGFGGPQKRTDRLTTYSRSHKKNEQDGKKK